MEIHNPMGRDGTVEDWETATKLWEYAVTSRLMNFPNTGKKQLDEEGGENIDAAIESVAEREKMLEDNPLLMTETGWNAGKNRERAIEVAMENWGCPAFWLARSGVLAA
jgi:actin-related protein 4